GDAPGVVRLVEPDTGRELARLTAPESTRLVPCCFTPDGSTLITLGTESEALHLFDLRAIRRQLADIGLDWDAPPIPAAATESREPLQIAVPTKSEFQRWRELHDTLYLAHQARRDGKHAEMLRLLRQAAQTESDQPLALNELAWVLLTGP